MTTSGNANVNEIVLDTLLGEYAKGKAKTVSPKPPEPEFLDVEDENSPEPAHKLMYSEITGSVPTGKDDFVIPSYVAEDWDEEDRVYIPEADSTFVWDHNVAYPLLKSLVMNKKVLIVGPTGAGKTEICRQICARINQPYFRINGRQDMEADTLLGKPWVSDGTMHFELGEFPKALRKGWFVAFDEPWKTPSGIQMALQRYYERNGILQLDDMPGTLEEKTVKPDPRSRLVLADNVVGTGDKMDKFGATLIQDASTINRMDVVLYQNYLQPEQEVGLITSKYKFVPEGKAKKVVQLARLIREGFEQGDLAATMSPRNIMSWMEMAYDLKDYKAAFVYTMLNRFADESEKGAVKNHWATVFGDSL